MKEDGGMVSGEGWQEKLHNREEWGTLLRTARNRCILHMPVERMNEQSFRSHYGPGVDYASYRNEYQMYFLGVKTAGA